MHIYVYIYINVVIRWRLNRAWLSQHCACEPSALAEPCSTAINHVDVEMTLRCVRKTTAYGSREDCITSKHTPPPLYARQNPHKMQSGLVPFQLTLRKSWHKPILCSTRFVAANELLLKDSGGYWMYWPLQPRTFLSTLSSICMCSYMYICTYIHIYCIYMYICIWYTCICKCVKYKLNTLYKHYTLIHCISAQFSFID